MTMNYEQKAAAMKCHDDMFCVRMRKPGDWYVSCKIDIGNGFSLTSASVYGAESPEKAIEMHWNKLTTLKQNEFLVTNAMDVNKRREFRWNGFMWDDVKKA